jgi:hypothetical protein
MPSYRSSALPDPLPRRTLDYLERGAPEGMRNAELFEAACQFRDAGFSSGEAEERLLGEVSRIQSRTAETPVISQSKVGIRLSGDWISAAAD